MTITIAKTIISNLFIMIFFDRVKIEKLEGATTGNANLKKS